MGKDFTMENVIDVETQPDRSMSNRMESCMDCIYSTDQKYDLWCPYLSRNLKKDDLQVVDLPKVCKHCDFGPPTGQDSAFIAHARRNAKWVSRVDFDAGFESAMRLMGKTNGEMPVQETSREHRERLDPVNGHHIEPIEYVRGNMYGDLPF
jgi:hypothetical protein